MSPPLIDRSPDLRKLRDEGYEVEISPSSYLLIHNVPYVTSAKKVARATLASELTLAGDRTTAPNTHVALFTGEQPCHPDGTTITGIVHSASTTVLAPGLAAKYQFSNKPANGYPNYYEKMRRYIDILSHPAKAIEATATAQTFKPIASTGDESVFMYLDTASSRAGIGEVSKKLEQHRVGIVGLGGTGSYVLDLLAKTPVAQIHLFDGDVFLQHNAFRSPGAASIEDLRQEQKKVDYFKTQYSRLHKHVIAHPYHVTESNAAEVSDLDFVFLCLDKAKAKQPIIVALEAAHRTFIDVGMGVEFIEEQNTLLGVLRVTTSADAVRDLLREKSRISLADDENDEYAQNIQLADLNALNAALAVLKWKKLCGFYQDLEREHHTTYSTNFNLLTSDDKK